MIDAMTRDCDVRDILNGETRLAGLTADSREVKPGWLFAALPGSRADGRAFIPEAVRHGATVILAPLGTALPAGCRGVRLITDAEPRRLFARIAAAFFGLQPATTVAVTGTNGKTSVVAFTRQIWQRLGCRAASLGTLGVVAPGLEEPGSLTTPDPVALHARLAELAASGVTHLALEASSHGLAQFRLDGLALVAAGFTNLGRDHLDYHGSRAAYFKAKARLFRELLGTHGVVVVNRDDESGAVIAEMCAGRGQRVVSYGSPGHAEPCDIEIVAVRPMPDALDLSIRLEGKPYRLTLPLVGRFQAENALCALGLVLATGGEPLAALGALESLKPVRGRLELAGRHPSGAPVFVDYAHTPDALAAALDALRPHAAGRLAVVFGCGGDRDTGKRPLMGGIAARLADRVIVTDDNPRSEPPAAIRAAILAASPGATEIGDRGEAICAGVDALGPGDVLLIAGKGHEQGQTIGEHVRPFDDATVARAALAALEGEPG
jgi:UDP-N-acetylmuramoyl-L-alanyl-D-glutamate--2,6-diaminopimelate ligase